MPSNRFVGLAMEGLSPNDQEKAQDATIQIADVTLYYGTRALFPKATDVKIVQLKYSVGKAQKSFRAADARNTIQKFAATYRDYRNRYGVDNVQGKLSFEIITNRPISPAFIEALSGLQSKSKLSRDAAIQANQIQTASGLGKRELSLFAEKLRVVGSVGSLTQQSRRLSRVIADWSASHDALAAARLGKIRQLLRDKAGSKGQGNNLITRVDILECLDLSDIEQLLPCPSAFPKVDKIVNRSQLPFALSLVSKLEKPLLVHATGGVGKTVFLQSLAGALSNEHTVLLFDCFGGGAYRAADDGRHLPSRGLVHIVNTLACDGLCDPLLPNNEDEGGLLRAFRNRLEQAVDTLRRATPTAFLVLLIDAIDNAADQARAKRQSSFPALILESFESLGPVPGVKLIVSCRTERRVGSKGEIECEELELKPFDGKETEQYLKERIDTVTNSQIQVAFVRSGGNPRILEHLALSDRGLLDPSEITKPIRLDTLLEQIITKALQDAQRKGHSKADIEAFIGGLGVLPPPVPVDEYADAHEMEASLVESFAADLAPLLERTKHGLMFRDEPTETLVKRKYAAKVSTLRKLASNLLRRQTNSVYASSSLPGLLTQLDDGATLFKLAFDDHFPKSISTKVGQQHIRHNRLTAAVLYAARKNEFGRLIQLLVELSSLAAVNERGTKYLLENPDLVVASCDVDATRRLFETRTVWPGTRHSRLTIAAILAGDIAEGVRHAIPADEWIRHYQQLDERERQHRPGKGPEIIDLCSIALCLTAQNRPKSAAQLLGRYYDWAAFKIGEHLFGFLFQAIRGKSIPERCLSDLLSALTIEVAVIASAIASLELDPKLSRQLLRKLAHACSHSKGIRTQTDSYGESEGYGIQDGLLKASVIALTSKMRKDGERIAAVVPIPRPDVGAFTGHFFRRNVGLFLIQASILAVARRKFLTEADILPGALARIANRVPEGLAGSAFQTKMKSELAKEIATQQKLPKEQRIWAYDRGDELTTFIDALLEPLLEMTRALAEVLKCAHGNADRAFENLLRCWESLRIKQEGYRTSDHISLFNGIGRQFALFVIWSRDDLAFSSVEAFLKKLTQSTPPVGAFSEVVTILAKRSPFQELAAKIAINAKALIEQQDDVSFRASALADLARAILPASRDEASAYFKLGLEQMDAIGSGDYEFTNQLLGFAASLNGKELTDPDFHTLTNICELNMYDEDKFPWAVFGQALARTSGRRGIAKLARWNDRDKVSFAYSLQPYLKTLVEDGKLEPTLAVAISHLVDPIELRDCGTGEFANAIAKSNSRDAIELISVLIQKFERDNPEARFGGTRSELCEVARSILGPNDTEVRYLETRAKHYDRVTDQDNNRYNDRNSPIPFAFTHGRRRKIEGNQTFLQRIIRKTDPINEISMASGTSRLEGLPDAYQAKQDFFDKIRPKVNFADRGKYLEIVARLPNINLHTKLNELKKCKQEWGDTSLMLKQVFKDLAVSLIEIHAKEFVQHHYFSGYLLREIFEFSQIPVSELAVKSAAILAAELPELPAPIWIGLASILSSKANKNESQAALSRLLRGGAAKLTSKVVDGPWRKSLYTNEGQRNVTATLIWQGLGSPWSAARWRAAHTLRVLGKLNRWDVIGAIVAKWNAKDALPFQAEELEFYYLHARLWLLIALNRLAIEYPERVFVFRSQLQKIALGKATDHVLLRHFAAQALQSAARNSRNHLPNIVVEQLNKVNQSPLPPVTAARSWHDCFFEPRPASVPAPSFEFHLDYDFEKYEVSSVANAFGRSGWEIKGAIASWVQASGQVAKSMYEKGGRESENRERYMPMNLEHHCLGQYLGWHALYQVAGEFLKKYPVTIDQYDGERWTRWLHDQILTRDDGLWLSDGVDRPPVSVQVNLLETGKIADGVTSNKEKLLELLEIGSKLPNEFVISGGWQSADGVKVRISSGLVRQGTSREMARSLTSEEPFHVYLPFSNDEGPLASQVRKKKPVKPWVTEPSKTARIDQTDPWAAISAMNRPRFAEDVQLEFSLKSPDPFNRVWLDKNGQEVGHSEAWGSFKRARDESSKEGKRLRCAKQFLKRVLTSRKAELVLLVILERYDKEHFTSNGKFWHTTAVVTINQALQMDYYLGAANKLYQPKF